MFFPLELFLQKIERFFSVLVLGFLLSFIQRLMCRLFPENACIMPLTSSSPKFFSVRCFELGTLTGLYNTSNVVSKALDRIRLKRKMGTCHRLQVDIGIKRRQLATNRSRLQVATKRKEGRQLAIIIKVIRLKRSTKKCVQ